MCIVIHSKAQIGWFFPLFQVDKLILIDASVYAESTGDLAKLPRILAYAGVSPFFNSFKHFLLILQFFTDSAFSIFYFIFVSSYISQVYLLKSIPLRLYATSLAFNGLPFDICRDWTNVSIPCCFLLLQMKSI